MYFTTHPAVKADRAKNKRYNPADRKVAVRFIRMLRAAKYTSYQIFVSLDSVKTMVGLRKKNVIYWFNCTEDYIVMDHAYSQNTGRSKSGICYRLDATRHLIKKLGLSSVGTLIYLTSQN